MMNKESSKIGLIGKGIEGIFSTFPNYFRIFIIIFALIITSSLLPVKVLIASDYKTDEYIKSWKVKDGDSFTVEYTHSVQLTTVTETYIIDGENIILLESYFHSLGAGLPATTPYKFEITEKGFRIYNINENMEYLVYRTGAERANHKLILKNKVYNFLDFSNPRTGVKLNMGKMTLLSYLTKEGFN